MAFVTMQEIERDDPGLFLMLEDLELVAHGVVEGALLGLHRSPYLGFSVEFEAHREYQRGDDLRHVNWNLWARHDRLFVKQYKANTNLDLHLMLDSTGSMRTEHGPTAKWRYAIRAAAAFALLAKRTHDAVGVSLIGDRIERHLPPRTSAGQFQDILGMLERAEPGGRASIGHAFEEMLSLCRRRGIVVLISDLFDNEEEISVGLKSLQQMGHDVIVVQVLDPWEVALPKGGTYEFHDLESGQRLRVVTDTVADSYAAKVRAWRERLRDRYFAAGIDWLSVRTDQRLSELLTRYIWRRAERRKGAGQHR